MTTNTAPNGMTREFTAQTRYTYVVVTLHIHSDGHPQVSLRTNSLTAARAKVGKVIASFARTGDRVEPPVVAVEHH